MSEKSNEFKCTLAACFDKVDDEGYEKLPLHCTIAPPFIVSEEKFPEIVSEFYNIISNWSSLLYDDGESTVIKFESNESVFGTDDRPVVAKRIDAGCGEQLLNLLALKEMIKESTENVCGQDATKEWYVGDLHVSETGQELPVGDEEMPINSLALFIKRDNKWFQNEVFYWNE